MQSRMFSLLSIYNFIIHFFFAPDSSLPVARYRIAFSILILINGILLRPNVKEWFGPDGFFSYEAFINRFKRTHLSLFSILPATHTTVHIVWYAHMIAALSLLAGFQSHVSAFFVYLTLVSFHHRNPFILYGGDSVLRAMSFLLIFSHAGDTISLDSYLYHGSLISNSFSNPWCFRLMQIQFSLIYLHSFNWKSAGETWRRGTAVFYSLHLQDLMRLDSSRILTGIYWYKYASWLVLASEALIGPLLWFKETRLIAIGMGIVLHLGFELFLNLQLFGFIMIAGFLLFLPV
jgi:hypothetical protein